MAKLPYAPRPGQDELSQAVARVQRSGGHLLAEAATGTGKTIAVLAASVESHHKDGRPTVWATRTNSQQTQVVREHQALAQSDGPDPGLVVPFMGRRHYCPLLREDERFRDGTPDELGRLCRDAKRKAQQAHDTGKTVDGACTYYAGLLRDGTGPVEALLRAGAASTDALATKVEKAGSCPYEALKLLMSEASLVVVPYVFVLDDKLRTTLMQWMGTGPDGVHLVIDEAHNLPAAARDHHTPKLSQTSLARATSEAHEWKDPVLGGTTLATTLLNEISKTIQSAVTEYVHNGEDGLVPPGLIQEDLMMRLSLPTPALRALAVDLVTWGEAIREDRRAKNRLPRSYLGAIGEFLHAWMSQLDGERVSIVTGGDNPALERYLLDPAAVLGWLAEFWSTTHMSGTLAPLQEHQDVLGLSNEDTYTLELGDPHKGALDLVAVKGLHRRYEDIQKDPMLTVAQQNWAMEALQLMPGRTALWFPSHRMMQEYLEEGFLHGTPRPLYVEDTGMSHTRLKQLVHDFRHDPVPGAMLCGVLGGRLTEGIDYPGDALQHILVFGIPYPKPTARSQALIHHYDRAFGTGWSVAVQTPVGRVLRQAVGRLIRGPDDRGIAVILDERAVRFHAQLPGLRTVETPPELLERPAQVDGYRTADALPLPKDFSTGSAETK